MPLGTHDMHAGGSCDERCRQVLAGLSVRIACTLPERLRGLLGREREGFSDVLLLVPCNDVHTFGMRRPIDVAFVTGDGEVVASWLGVGRRRRVRCKRAAATLERFASEAPWFQVGDRVELKRLVAENRMGEKGSTI